MKRITIAAHGLGGGGAEKVAANLATQMAKHGYKVQFISVYNDKRDYYLDDRISWIIIRRRRSRMGRLFWRSFEIRRAIVTFQSELVISFVINELLWSSVSSRIPIIYSMRNDPQSILSSWIDVRICSFLYRRSKKIVFQTEMERAFFSPDIQKKGVIIGNPISSKLPFWTKEHCKKRIITAARLTEQKNLTMLLHGFAEFLKSYPEYSLMICGDGPLRAELTDLARKLQIGDSVEFTGFTPNVDELIADSAVFVLTSNFEGVSNAMLEALAIGIPVICTDCPAGGAKQYIRDHENGILIPVRDENCLTQRLVEVVQNRKLQKHLSEQAVLIRDQLNENTVFEAWERLF